MSANKRGCSFKGPVGRISWHIDTVPNTAHSLGSMVAAEKCKRLKGKVQGLFTEAAGKIHGSTDHLRIRNSDLDSVFSLDIFPGRTCASSELSDRVVSLADTLCNELEHFLAVSQ